MPIFRHLTFLPIFFCLVPCLAQTQPVRLDPVRVIDLPEEADGLRTLQYANGNVYFAPFFRPEVAVFSIDAETIVKTFGRKGGGPGEFDVPVIAIKVTSDRLIVRSGSALNLFALDGTFQKKVVPKSDMILQDLADIGNGEYLLSARLAGISPTTQQLTLKSAIGVFDSNVGGAVDFSRFEEGFVSEYPELERFVIGSNAAMAAFAQAGSNTVTFASRDGKPIKKVQLRADPEKITFVKAADLEPGLSHSDAALKGGNPNRLFPSRLLVENIVMAADFTIVHGSFDTAEGPRNIAVVDHKTWKVTYLHLPVNCLGMALDGDRLICLAKREEGRQLHLFKIHAV